MSDIVKNPDNFMRDLAYEEIAPGYYKGKYLGLDVILNSDGWPNMSQLCKKEGKNFKNWKGTDQSKRLIDRLSTQAARAASDILPSIVGGKVLEIRGTYAHPKLVPHIASWISEDIAFSVSDIVNGFLIKQERDKLQQEIKEKDNKIDKLNNDIQEIKRMHNIQMANVESVCKELRISNAKLEESNNKLAESNNKLETTNSELRATRVALAETRDELSATNETNEYLLDRVERVTDRLDSIAPNVVVNQNNPDKDEIFVIMRNLNYDHEKSAAKSKRNKREGFKYIAMCGTFEYTKTKKYYMRRKQGYVEVVTIAKNPNTKNLLNRIRQLLAEDSDIIEIYCNWFSIIDSQVIETQLVELIRDIDNDRYDICNVRDDEDSSDDDASPITHCSSININIAIDS